MDLHGGDVARKFTALCSTEQSLIYRDILDCYVFSCQPTGTKIVFMTLSQNGVCTDTNIIIQILDFQKRKIFSADFCQLSDFSLKVILINQGIHL